MSKLTLNMSVTKATPGTIVFSETIDPEDVLAEPRIKGVYVPKHLLRELGWNGDGTLKLTLEV